MPSVPDPSSTFGRDMVVGIAAWSAFSLLALALRRVVIDEAVVPGQIISGLVNYAGGHPHDIFYKTAYNFPNLASGWFLSLWGSELALSVVRNWLFLSLSLVTPFVVAHVLTRRPSWGHIAAALTLFGGHLLYAGIYPMRVFPNFHSHGHIGLQLAVLAGALVVGRQRLAGGVLAGMMPAMHAAMTLAVWPWLAIYMLWLQKMEGGAAVRRILVGLGIGVLFCVAVAFLIPFTSIPVPPVPPYDALVGIDAARAGFAAFTDSHRMLPAFSSRAYLLNPAAFLALSYVLIWWSSNRPGTWTDRSVEATAIAGMGLFALGIVYGAWLLEIVLGKLPGPVWAAMPYRFSNVTATLLIPMSIAATAALVNRMDERDGRLAQTVAAVAVVALGLAMSGFVKPDIKEAVVRQMVALLWGLPFGLGLWAFAVAREHRWHLILPTGMTILAAVALWHDNKGALVLAAASVCCMVGAWLAQRLLRSLTVPALRFIRSTAMAGAVIVCVVSVVTARGAEEPHGDSIFSDDDIVAIQTWLSANATPDEHVLQPLRPRMPLQTKARHPVLFEAETLWLMTYMPSLAPRIGTMARDLYGIDYGRIEDFVERCPGGRVFFWCDVWNDAWRARTRDEWVDLARKYRFRLVLAPAGIDIDLPVVLKTGNANLYEIPSDIQDSPRRGIRSGVSSR